MRDRLIELLNTKIYPKIGVSPAEVVADFLLDNGVIVPPCKVGDKLYYISHRANNGQTEKYIKEETVEMISVDSYSIYAHIPRALLIDLADIGKTVFLTKEEAEQALRKEDEGK